MPASGPASPQQAGPQGLKCGKTPGVPGVFFGRFGLPEHELRGGAVARFAASASIDR